MTNKITVTPDYTRYYSEKSKEWAISDKIVDNTDYSSKYYANESKKQADISTAKTTEVVASGNTAVSNIESARDNAISSAVSAISTQQTNAVKAVQNQQTSSVNTVKSTGQSYVDKCKAWASSDRTVEGGLYSAKYYAEMAQGKSDVTYETLRASRAYEDKGALLTDEQGYAEVAKYRHSTFDKSKFTLVGSPTITDDGIASNLNKNNYLTSNVTISNATKIVIEGIFNCGETSTESKFIRRDGGSVGVISSRVANHQIYYASNSTGTDAVIITDASIINTNTNVSFCLEITSNLSTLTATNLDTGATKTLTNSMDNSAVLASWSSVHIGHATNDAGSVGSINLKHLTIKVDEGKEVFSGNKTGIDIIKPDNYDIVGSPVINEVGVANGFSASDYITKTFNSVTEDTVLEIYTRVKSPSSYSNAEVPINIGNSNREGFGIYFRNNTTQSNPKKLEICGNLSLNLVHILTPYELDTYYSIYAKIEFSTGTLYAEIRDDAGTLIVAGSAQGSSVNYAYNNGEICLGKSRSSTTYIQPFSGKIDLNATKIYVDGNLVYQPCLKIPYTQSKTGSKIVDVAYRDRVIDLYEQEGQAGYYTIDETNKNFTLPMGEIYGMIGQRSLISSTVTETNRVDIYSDKTCLICGNVATAGTINLPIELVNNNYFITLSTSAKTATSFTTTATGDYILIGKVI